MYANPYTQYFEQNFENQPVNIQVALSLNKAANLVEEAKVAIEEKRYDVRFEKIQHATKIILILHDSMTEESSEEMIRMSKRLKRFYQIILTLFDQIDLRNDLDYANQAITSLNAMAKTWQELEVTQDVSSSTASQQLNADVANKSVEISA